MNKYPFRQLMTGNQPDPKEVLRYELSKATLDLTRWGFDEAIKDLRKVRRGEDIWERIGKELFIGLCLQPVKTALDNARSQY